MADHTTDRQHAFDKLLELIKDIKVAMMTTVDFDGGLRARPMSTHARGNDGRLYFFTRATAGKVNEVEDDAHVCLAYAEPRDQRYVSVSGTVRISRDKALIDELWKPTDLAWFPEGRDDPELAVMVVDCYRAEYWDAPSTAMVHLYGVVKSTLTGITPRRLGEHGKMELPAEVPEEPPGVH